MRKLIFFFCIACVVCACNRPSKADQYRADKHYRDSVALVDQERTLTYYQSLLDSLQPQADSLLTFFKYEKNDKYQDHGNYVVKNSAFGYAFSDLRILVRDVGTEVLVYRNGKRVTSEGVHELKRNGKRPWSAHSTCKPLLRTSTNWKNASKKPRWRCKNTKKGCKKSNILAYLKIL